MKKLLLLFAVLATYATTVSAQFLQADASNVLVKNPAASLLKADVMQAPAKADLASNQKLMANYTSEDLPVTTYSLGAAGTYPSITLVPSTIVEKFVGGKIVGLRFAVAGSIGSSRVFAMPFVNGQLQAEVLSQNVTTTTAGWNTVMLDTPYEIKDNTPLFLGYEFNQVGSAYSFYFVGNQITYGALIYGDFSSGVAWYDFSAYGQVPVQAIVESDNFAQKDIVIDEVLVNSYVNGGKPLQLTVNLQNFGVADIEKYVLDVEVDGSKIGTLEDAIAASAKKSLVGSVALPEGLALGNHVVRVSVATIDGEVPTENVDDDAAEAAFYLYENDDVVEHQKYLVEELTSHSCTYCPYGAELVKAMLKNHADVTAVCIHGNLSSQDPWNTSECDQLNSLFGLQSWPTGIINRIYDEKESVLARGFGYYPQYSEMKADEFYDIMQNESMPAFATVDISAQADKENNKVNITVKGQGSVNAKTHLAGSSLTVYIIEEGILGQQLNLGTWENLYEHKHVLRDVVTNIVGDNIKWTDDTNYENTYSVSIQNSWNADNLRVVAFISQKPTSSTNPDRRKMKVSNANDADVVDATAISNVETQRHEVARYTIDGRMISTPQKGVNIIQLSDGTTLKQIVR